MKRSTTVMLVLSGSLLGGCGQRPTYTDNPAAANPSPADNGLVTSEAFGDVNETNAPAITNNTYVAQRGYYHAPYRAWFPFPYNHFIPGSGYYHGGAFTPAPHNSSIRSSRPTTVSRASKSSTIVRGGFTRSGFSRASS